MFPPRYGDFSPPYGDFFFFSSLSRRLTIELRCATALIVRLLRLLRVQLQARMRTPSGVAS